MVVPVPVVGCVTVPVVDVVDVVPVRHGDVAATLGVLMAVPFVGHVGRSIAFVDVVAVGAVDVTVVGVVGVVPVRHGDVAATFAMSVLVPIVRTVLACALHQDSFHDASHANASPVVRHR